MDIRSQPGQGTTVTLVFPDTLDVHARTLTTAEAVS
jgi:hypothetical protein